MEVAAPLPNETTPTTTEATQSAAMTLAFTDSDDKFTDEEGGDFCAASMSQE